MSTISVSDEQDIIATNYVGVAGMTVLLYDYLLTLGDEVDYIWLRRKGYITYLFFLNRYFTPFGFVINMLAYLSPLFNQGVCTHFVKYEGAFTTVSLAICALMMIVRVNAVYGGHKGVLALLLLAFSAQVGVHAWLLSGARPLTHTDGDHDCTMIFGKHIHAWGSTYAWMPLLFDTIVLVLMLFRTARIVRSGSAGLIVRTLVKDGIIYYAVIFSSNLVLAVMLVAAPDGIKGINAQLEQLITVTMMSRITITLKKGTILYWEGERTTAVWYHTDSTAVDTALPRPPNLARKVENAEAYEMWDVQSTASPDWTALHSFMP